MRLGVRKALPEPVAARADRVNAWRQHHRTRKVGHHSRRSLAAEEWGPLGKANDHVGVQSGRSCRKTAATDRAETQNPQESASHAGAALGELCVQVLQDVPRVGSCELRVPRTHAILRVICAAQQASLARTCEVHRRAGTFLWAWHTQMQRVTLMIIVRLLVRGSRAVEALFGRCGQCLRGPVARASVASVHERVNVEIRRNRLLIEFVRR
eukprot:scaffold922_cov327-Pinguiococcus_pyrenoidosus.AAC.48